MKKQSVEAPSADEQSVEAPSVDEQSLDEQSAEDENIKQGQLIWYNERKGYGFVKVED